MRRSSVLRGGLVPLAAFVAVGLIGASPSRAAAPPVVVWDAPASCLDGRTLQAELARRVGDSDTRISEIRVRARLQAGGWDLVVGLVEDGLVRERILTVESCEAAVQAAVFMVTLAIEAGRALPTFSVPPPPAPPSALSPAEIPAPSEPTAPSPAETPAPSERAAPTMPAIEAGLPVLEGSFAALPSEPPSAVPPGSEERPRPGRAQPQGLINAGMGLHAGLLPVGIGLAAGTGVQWPRFHALLGYTWFPRTEVRLPAQPTVGGNLSVHAATLRVGPALRTRGIELPLYVGVELGVLRAVGLGADVNFTRTTLWGAACAGLGVGWAPGARGMVALRIIAEVAVALRRPSLTIGDVEVDRIGRAGFRSMVMLEVRLPSLAQMGTPGTRVGTAN